MDHVKRMKLQAMHELNKQQNSDTTPDTDDEFGLFSELDSDIGDIGDTGDDIPDTDPAAVDYASMTDKDFEKAVTKIKDDPPAPPQDEYAAALKPWADDLREHLTQSRASREAGADGQADDAEAGFDLSLLEPEELGILAQAGRDSDVDALQKLTRKYGPGFAALLPEGTL